MTKRLRLLGISGAMATAAALLLSGLWLAQPAAAGKAAETLARCVEAMPDPSTVHIVAKMRTPPNDNFGCIITDGDLVPIEVWKQFGEQRKWRMEEPGRVVVMDGASTLQVMRLRQPNLAWKWPPDTEEEEKDWGPVLKLANLKGMITRELLTALAKGWDLKLAHETMPLGEKKLAVTVEAKAGVPDDDYLKNKYLDDSDVRYVYRFDAETQRLEEMEAYLHQPGGDLLVLCIEQIEYDQPIDPAVFTLQLPEDVQWAKETQRLPDNEKYENMTPLEAARAFFEACANEDWDEEQKFDTDPPTEDTKTYLGGLQIISLGEPFQSKGYAGGKGWFIPYEIKLKNGTIHKHNLAMRNDNEGNRYVVDGGI